MSESGSVAASRILRQSDIDQTSPVADSLKMKLSEEILKTRRQMVDPEIDAIKEPKGTWSKINMYMKRIKKYITESIICKSLLAGLIVCIVLLITEPEIIMYSKKSTSKPVHSKNELIESSDDETESESESPDEEKGKDTSETDSKTGINKDSKKPKGSVKKPSSTLKSSLSKSTKKVKYAPQDIQSTKRGVQYGNVALIGILAGISAAFLF